MRLLALALLCSSFMYASDVQEGSPKQLEVVLKLGTLIPQQLVKPFQEGEKPQKGDLLAWKRGEEYRLVRVTRDKPSPIVGYHVQHNWEDKTCVPLASLFKILKQAKARL